MQAAISWDDVSIVGAFLVGFLVGVVVVLRLVKVVAGFLRTERDKES